MTIRVFIVDDQQMFREGLRAMLAADADIDVVGEAENGRAALKLVRDAKPDVVVMDVSMPDLNGIEATRQIKSLAPNVRVIALSAHSDQRFVSRMLEAGASGYLLKEGAFDELSRAIRNVAAGMDYLSPSVTTGVVEASLGMAAGPKPSGPAELTPRQREVLQLIAEGLNTKEVAARLHVSVKTVETHRQQVLKRLGLQGVADITRYAIREGLVSAE
jgi:DNA-binding NarL/FixJ family response regulator